MCRATAGSRASRSIIISIIDCFYDIAGWAGPDHAAEWGADWVRFGLDELSFSQLVFASDYPQAVRELGEVASYVEAVRALGGNGRALVAGINAEKLIRDIAQPACRAPEQFGPNSGIGAGMNDKAAGRRSDFRSRRAWLGSGRGP